MITQVLTMAMEFNIMKGSEEFLGTFLTFGDFWRLIRLSLKRLYVDYMARNQITPTMLIIKSSAQRKNARNLSNYHQPEMHIYAIVNLFHTYRISSNKRPGA